MPYLIGILLDVSSSMKNVFETFEAEDGKRSHSVFSVINDLVGKSVSPGNNAFAIGFGGQNVSSQFDILGSLQSFRETYDKKLDEQNYEETLENIYRYANIRDVMSLEDIKLNVPFYLLKLVSEGLNRSEKLRKTLKDIETASSTLWLFNRFANDYIVRKIKKIKNVVTEDDAVKELLLKTEIRTFDFAIAIDILRYWLEGKLLNNDSIRGIMKNVTPFIYGSSNLFTSIDNSVSIFTQEIFKHHEKYLFVLSTGGTTDDENLLEHIKEAKISTRDKGIKIVSCYISTSTESALSQSRTLFGSVKEEWDAGARALFKLSSGITTKLLPHAIFRARNWKVETINDEIKLFFQINDPDLIQEACSLASEVVGSQDALLGILGDISLAEYIKSTNEAFTAQSQVGRTCYANATAAVLHLAMKRIVYRKAGYPEFNKLRKELIDKHGIEGAYMTPVLTGICPKYRLHWKYVNVDTATNAIAMGRSLIAIFYLTNGEWKIFSNFFKNNSTGVLTKNELDIDNRISGLELEGHAVVLTSFNNECFRFMNSWGEKWGDLGFFRVKNEKVLDMTFIDVSWTLKDLYPEELEHFKNHGASLAKKLLQRFTDLNDKIYACPKCTLVSKVTEFTGTLSEACCPKCEMNFKCSDDIVMNLYLSSLLQKP